MCDPLGLLQANLTLFIMMEAAFTVAVHMSVGTVQKYLQRIKHLLILPTEHRPQYQRKHQSVIPLTPKVLTVTILMVQN